MKFIWIKQKITLKVPVNFFFASLLNEDVQYFTYIYIYQYIYDQNWNYTVQYLPTNLPVIINKILTLRDLPVKDLKYSPVI